MNKKKKQKVTKSYTLATQNPHSDSDTGKAGEQRKAFNVIMQVRHIDLINDDEQK